MNPPADDLDALDEPLEGAVMHEAIRKWVASIYDGEACVTTRFVVIAECDDGDARWLEVGSFSADGHALAEWESVGMLEYARRVERGDFRTPDADEDDE